MVAQGMGGKWRSGGYVLEQTDRGPADMIGHWKAECRSGKVTNMEGSRISERVRSLVER